MDFSAMKPVRDNVRSIHPLNKMHTTTGDFFRWDVVHAMPLVQGDVISYNCNTFIESAPNPYAINGSCSYGQYAFFVPFRIVWSDWKYYIENLKPNLQKPYFTLGDLWKVFEDLETPNPWRENYYYDAFRYISNIDNLASVLWIFKQYSTYDSIPTQIKNFKLDAMPLRMAQRIWWDWMRDKMHISDAVEDSYNVKTGGHISITELIMLCTPKWRCFPKNYITTCFDSPADDLFPGANNPSNNVVAGVSSSSDNQFSSQYGGSYNSMYSTVNAGGTNAYLNDDLFVGHDNSGEEGNPNQFLGVSVNDMRFASSLQNYLERIMVAGKTVLSRALALFGVSPTIEELQMSNYLGGHEEDLLFNTSSAAASARATTGNPESNSAGPFGYNPLNATAFGQKTQNMSVNADGFQLNDIQYKTDEAGYLFVFGCITPRVQYFQGLPRNWTLGLETFASDRFDYFHSDFENQPLQPVLNYEVCFGPGINLKNVYGFNEMYMQYKTCMDSIGGDYVNSHAARGLKDKVLSRDVWSLLNEMTSEGGDINDYITPTVLCNSSGYDKDIFDDKFTLYNDGTYDHFDVNHKISITANRPMQSHCLPSLDPAISQGAKTKLVDAGAFRL